MSDEREELSSLVRSLRAHIAALGDAGTTGLPPAPRLARTAATVVARAPATAPSPPMPPLRETTGNAPPRDPAPRGDAAERPEIPRGDARELPAALREEPGAPPEARVARLSVLATQVSGCTRCVLHQTRTQTVFARGNPRAELCFVGEGPGAEEDAQGLPFVGKAGQLLDRMIAAMGYRPDEVYVCNVVKCRPPANRKPEPDEMRSCMPYLAEQLALVEPRVIVALGGTAAEGLIGAPVAITRLRGQWRLYRGSIPLMPTFHPAYLLRTPEAKREAWADLRAVLERLGRPVPRPGTT